MVNVMGKSSPLPSRARRPFGKVRPGGTVRVSALGDHGKQRYHNGCCIIINHNGYQLMGINNDLVIKHNGYELMTKSIVVNDYIN